VLKASDSVLHGGEVSHDISVHERSGSFAMTEYDICFGLLG